VPVFINLAARFGRLRFRDITRFAGGRFAAPALRRGTSYRVSHRLLQNDPKRIIARTPALPAGKYTLTVVTHYSSEFRKVTTYLIGIGLNSEKLRRI
jgi:hypothetical protein